MTGEVHPQVPRLEAHLGSIGHPSLRLNGAGRLSLVPSLAAAIEPAAPCWDWLSQAPRVAVARDFATREECSYLMFKSAAALGDARSYRRAGGNDDGELELFSGSGRPVDAMRSDVVVRVLERRIATMTRWHVAALEPCSIIRYRPGQQYRPHVTSSPISRSRRSVLCAAIRAGSGWRPSCCTCTRRAREARPPPTTRRRGYAANGAWGPALQRDAGRAPGPGIAAQRPAGGAARSGCGARPCASTRCTAEPARVVTGGPRVARTFRGRSASHRHVPTREGPMLALPAPSADVPQ